MPTYCPGVDVANGTLFVNIPGVFVDNFLDGTDFAQGQRDGYPPLLGQSYDERTDEWRGRGRAVRLAFPLEHLETAQCLEALVTFANSFQATLGGGRGRPDPDERALANAVKAIKERCAHALALLPAIAT